MFPSKSMRSAAVTQAFVPVESCRKLDPPYVECLPVPSCRKTLLTMNLLFQSLETAAAYLGSALGRGAAHGLVSLCRLRVGARVCPDHRLQPITTLSGRAPQPASSRSVAVAHSTRSWRSSGPLPEGSSALATGRIDSPEDTGGAWLPGCSKEAEAPLHRESCQARPRQHCRSSLARIHDCNSLSSLPGPAPLPCPEGRDAVCVCVFDVISLCVEDEEEPPPCACLAP